MRYLLGFTVGWFLWGTVALSGQTKSLYVDGLKYIIGDYYKENELLQYAKDSGYDYLLCYNINYIHHHLFDITDPVTAKPLSDFIHKAKVNYGISKVGAIGEKYSSFDAIHDYNLDHINIPEERFDVYNLEFEFWNPNSTGPGGYYCTTYLEPRGLPCDTGGAFQFIYPELCKIDSTCDEYDWLHSEIYIGNPTTLQCAKVAKCADRVLVHYYRKKDVYNNGNSIYNYKSYRLEPLTDSVDFIHVMPIFSGEDNFMGPWLKSHSEAQPFHTWLHGKNAWDAQTGAWKKKMNIDGYVWFTYTVMHNTNPPPPPSLNGTIAFFRYTSWGAQDGELYTYNFENDTLKPISASWSNVENTLYPDFSPDGKYLTFMGFDVGTTDWDIFLWEVDSGNDPVNLTDGRNTREEYPHFSPDGRKIIYKERYFNGGFKYRFQEMDLDGNIVNTITPSGDKIVENPVYSPKGDKIYFTKDTLSSADIYSIFTDGSGETALQDSASNQQYYPATLTPDKYVFTQWVSSSRHIDQLLLSEGDSTVKLPFVDTFDYSYPHYMKEDILLFSSTRPGTKGGYDLYIGDMNSGRVWSLSLYDNGMNTGQEELGVTYVKTPFKQPAASDFICVDHIGYRPGDKKIAVVRNPITGYDSSKNYTAGSMYELRRRKDSTAVGTFAPVMWKGGQEHDQSGDKCWWVDFSSWVTPGEYYLTETGKDTGSYPFVIGDSAYDAVLKQAVRSFYYQRCGTPKSLPWADYRWTDTACHLGTLQDRDCRLVSDTSSSTSRDLSGGWHDAGDHNKYINYADIAIHDLLAAYEENPEVWGDNYALPESGNGVPDILDEAKWELDWFLKMQKSDGSVLHKVSVTQWGGSTCPPSSETLARRYAPATASATINACGVWAHAAIVFRSLPYPEMQAYADTLEQAAKDAWNWIDTHPADIPSNYDNAGFLNSAAEDGSYTQYANITAASAYLLVLTGDTTTYRDYFNDHYKNTHLFQWNAIAIYFKDPQINSALLYYGISPYSTDSIVMDIRNQYMIAATDTSSNFDIINQYNDSTDAYRAYLYDCGWGSNAYRCYGGSAFTNIVKYGLDTVNDDNHRDAAEGYLHFIHGTNPLQQLYLSRLEEIGGEHSVPEFYHGWFEDSTGYDNADSSLYGPAPGYLVGGPNETYVSPGPDTIAPPELQPWQKSYKNWNNADDNSWEITENQDRYQSAYLKLLGSFVIPHYSPLLRSYYVSVKGDNNNPGTLQRPWRTIDYACHHATPNANIYVLEGMYKEQVYVAVDSIYVRNYLGQKVRLDGSNESAGPMIEIQDRKGVTFEGITVQNAMYNDAQGVLIHGKSEHITLKNCVFHNIHFSADSTDPVHAGTNAQPIIVYGDSTTAIRYLVIEDNEVYHCRVGYSEGLAINGNVDTFDVRRNTLWDLPNIAIDAIGHEGTCPDPSLDQARHGNINENTVYDCQSAYAANAGIYIDGAKDITLERNTCYRNIWGIEVGCEHTGKSASNIEVRNNVLFRNAKSGIALGGYDYPSGSGKVTDVHVYNNSLYDNDTLNDYEAEINLTYAEHCSFRNNVVFSTNTDNLIILQGSNTAPVDLTLDSNLYYHTIGINDAEFEWQGTSYTGFNAWKTGTGQDLNTLFGDPLFVNTTVFPPDLHLQSGSPAVESGTNNGLQVDRDSLPRPQLMTIDKGAYEFGNYWIGAVSHDWHTPANWSKGAVPTSSESVTIPPPTFYTYFPKVMANAQVKAIYFYGNSQLYVEPGVTFTVQN